MAKSRTKPVPKKRGRKGSASSAKSIAALEEEIARLKAKAKAKTKKAKPKGKTKPKKAKAPKAKKARKTKKAGGKPTTAKKAKKAPKGRKPSRCAQRIAAASPQIRAVITRAKREMTREVPRTRRVDRRRYINARALLIRTLRRIGCSLASVRATVGHLTSVRKRGRQALAILRATKFEPEFDPRFPDLFYVPDARNAGKDPSRRDDLFNLERHMTQRTQSFTDFIRVAMEEHGLTEREAIDNWFSPDLIEAA